MRWIGQGFSFFVSLWILALPLGASKASLKNDFFQSSASRVSVMFKAHQISFAKEREEYDTHYWASRDVAGFSFRVDYLFRTPIAQMFFFYPDADPFIQRFLLLSSEKLCYKNTLFRKDSTLDPHLINAKFLWRALLNPLIEDADGRKTLLGEETLAGYRCRKIRLENQMGNKTIVWFSPKLDLILKYEIYSGEKIVKTWDVVEIKEGRLPPASFLLPRDCRVHQVTSEEFNQLDLEKRN